jgi:hypothetical protein
MERMSKIHIWIGSTSLDKEKYSQYFEFDYSTENYNGLKYIGLYDSSIQ